MARKLTSLSLNEEQRVLLASLMGEDHATSTTAFMVSLLSAERKRRDEARTSRSATKAVGRPRKDTVGEEDEPRNIPHPDTFSEGNRGRMLTQSEYEAWLALHP